jgi:hypothetical protein
VDATLDSCHRKIIIRIVTKINYFAPLLGRKRLRTLIERAIATEPRLPRRLLPLCLALKWF